MPSNRKTDETKAKTVFAQTHTKTKQRQKTSKTKRHRQRTTRLPGKVLEETLWLLRLVPRGAILPERLFYNEDAGGSVPFSDSRVLEEAIRRLPPKLTEHLMAFIDREGAFTGRIKAQAAYNRILQERDIFESIIHLIHSDEIRRLKECQACKGIFFAEQPNQRFCSDSACKAAAKKDRQIKWQEKYKQEHGHAYRQVREPGRRRRVRQALEWWEKTKGKFEPSNGNLKDLAAYADVTLKECQADYKVILDERKRAKTARKRR